MAGGDVRARFATWRVDDLAEQQVRTTNPLVQRDPLTHELVVHRPRGTPDFGGPAVGEQFEISYPWDGFSNRPGRIANPAHGAPRPTNRIVTRSVSEGHSFGRPRLRFGLQSTHE